MHPAIKPIAHAMKFRRHACCLPPCSSGRKASAAPETPTPDPVNPAISWLENNALADFNPESIASIPSTFNSYVGEDVSSWADETGDYVLNDSSPVSTPAKVALNSYAPPDQGAFEEGSDIKMIRDELAMALTWKETGGGHWDGSEIFDNAFELWTMVSLRDGRPNTRVELCGVVDTADINIRVRFSIEASGKLLFQIGNTTDGRISFQTTAAVFDNGNHGFRAVVFKWDRTTPKIYVDFVEEPGTFTFGTSDQINYGAGFSSADEILIGSLHNQGSIISNSNSGSTKIKRMWFIPHPPDQEMRNDLAVLIQGSTWNEDAIQIYGGSGACQKNGVKAYRSFSMKGVTGPRTITFTNAEGGLSMSPSSLDFTVLNQETPQKIEITAVNDTVKTGVKYETLTATSGADTKSVIIRVFDQVSRLATDPWEIWYNDHPFYDRFHFKTAAGGVTHKNLKKTLTFNTTTLPTAEPEAVETDWAGTDGTFDSEWRTGLTPVMASVDRYEVQIDHPTFGGFFKMFTYHVKPSAARVGTLAVYFHGHDSEADSEVLTGAYLENGFDVLIQNMPLQGPNIAPAGSGIGSHNDMIDAEEKTSPYFHPHSVYTEAMIRTIVKVESLLSFTSRFCAGTSGGGLQSMHIAGLWPEKFDFIQCMLSSQPFPFDRLPDTPVGFDWEDELPNVPPGTIEPRLSAWPISMAVDTTAQVSNLDNMMIMAAHGKKAFFWGHQEDAGTGLPGLSLHQAKYFFNKWATDMGGEFDYIEDSVNQDDGEHAPSLAAIKHILEQAGLTVNIREVRLDFGGGTLETAWNNINDGTATTVYSNLTDDIGGNSGLSLTIGSVGFTANATGGSTTGDDSGVMPDDVLLDNFTTDTTGDDITLGGLNNLKRYHIEFTGSGADTLEILATCKHIAAGIPDVPGKTGTHEVATQTNTSLSERFDGLVPLSGDIILKVRAKSGSTNGVLSGAIITYLDY